MGEGEVLEQTADGGNGDRFAELSALYGVGAHAMSDEDRRKVLHELSQPVAKASPGELGSVMSMSFGEELLAVLFLFVVVGSMFWIPLAMILFLVFVRSLTAYVVLFAVFIILSSHPLKRSQAFVHSRLNKLLFRYFSLRMAWETELPGGRRYLLIAPPHGILPMGNLLTMHALKNIFGWDFLGITTDAALKLPIFRHYLIPLGLISATSSVLLKALKDGWSIGISTGGVAEIFETLNKDEVILMQDRKGFVKMALKTGTAIVPCYIFGNTKLVSAWYDPYGVLRTLSRKLKAGCLLLWGRWGLPVMHRVPILGVIAAPIEVPRVEQPSQEQIDHYHAVFVKELQALFDKHKGAYGWADKKLIIK